MDYPSEMKQKMDIYAEARRKEICREMEKLRAVLDGQKVPVKDRIVWPKSEGIGGA